VVAAFGKQILNPDGSVDRRELGKIVFADRKALSRLNRIMHPQIYRVVKAELEQYKKQGVKAVVIDAPLLIEASWATMVDSVWVVTATETSVIKRLEKTGLSRDETMLRLRSQLTESERARIANVVINNDYSPDELKQKVNKLWQGLQFDTCR
jgi:dephospho-CoA kinase